MNTGMLLIFGIAVFALAIGVVGCFLGAAESAERRLREARRHVREPWNAEIPGDHDLQAISLSGPTPT